MNTDEIRAVLVERADGVDVHRPGRADEVLDRVRSHRRRRVGAAVGGASVLVLALVGGVALFAGGPAPTSDPVGPSTSKSAEPSSSPVRKLTWTPDWWPTLSINYGDRSVDIRPLIEGMAPKLQDISKTSIHMDVTADGVVFTTYDGRVWFTDGSGYEQIGDVGRELLGQWNASDVGSGTSGSLVAWVQNRGDIEAELVAYDTAERAEVARFPVRGCTTLGGDCVVRAMVADERIYLERTAAWNSERPARLFRFDVPTGQLTRVTESDLAADLASGSRALIIGDSSETGLVTDGYSLGRTLTLESMVHFLRDEGRLVPQRVGVVEGDPALLPTSAFDTGTGREVRFRLPAGAQADDYSPFEWIDDDRLALMAFAQPYYRPGWGEILVCRISTGRCTVVVNQVGGDDWPLRTVPHLGYPG